MKIAILVAAMLLSGCGPALVVGSGATAQPSNYACGTILHPCPDGSHPALWGYMAQQEQTDRITNQMAIDSLLNGAE